MARKDEILTENELLTRPATKVAAGKLAKLMHKTYCDLYGALEAVEKTGFSVVFANSCYICAEIDAGNGTKAMAKISICCDYDTCEIDSVEYKAA